MEIEENDRKIAHDWQKHSERTVDIQLKQTIPFDELPLSDELRKGIANAGYKYPTVLQAKAIPFGCSGIDLLIQSQSGTGKTMIFCTVLLELYEKSVNHPQSLVLAPTREIAVQIEDILNKLGTYLQDFKAVSVIGGLDINEDRKKLRNVKAIVGTPGRVLHLIQNRIINTSQIELFVIDEVDRLMSHTFRQDLKKILASLPRNKQMIACSATFDNDLDTKLANYMEAPLFLSTDQRATTLIGIKQFVYEIEEQPTSILEMQSKLTALKFIFGRIRFQQCLAFTSSQSRGDSYFNALIRDEWPCENISGAMNQNVRLAIFKKFLELKIRILIATDLMSRGIDSDKLNLIINLELPDDGTTYLHRIGRGGRFGSHAIAITFIANQKDRKKFSKIIDSIDPNMKVLKFPITNPDYNFWNFKNLENEPNQLGIFTYKSEENLLENENGNGNNEIAVVTNNINTQTYEIEAKELNLNKIPLKETMSSIQLFTSSNTIDDASSLAIDSDILQLQSAAHCSDIKATVNSCQPIIPQAEDFNNENIRKVSISDDPKNKVLKINSSVPLAGYMELDWKSLLVDQEQQQKNKIRDVFSEYGKLQENTNHHAESISDAICNLKLNLSHAELEVPICEENSVESRPIENPLLPSPRIIVEDHVEAQIEDFDDDINSDGETDNSVETASGGVSSSGFDERTSSDNSSGIVSSSTDESNSLSGRSSSINTLNENYYYAPKEQDTSEADDESCSVEILTNEQKSLGNDTNESGYAVWNNLYYNQMQQIQNYVQFCSDVCKNLQKKSRY